MARVFVSVLIDTYNHERFIAEAIQSVLGQDFPASDREILVVDDGSTDRTPEILRKFEPDVRILRRPNGGQASVFNVGIPECRGEIIAFLDGDDWWTLGKLRRVAEVLAGDVAIGIVGHGIFESFDDGTLRAIAPEKPQRMRLNSAAAANLFRLHKSFLGTSRLTLRTAIARQILPVPKSCVIEADEYLFTVAGALSDLVILQDTLTHYRLHGANLYYAAGRNNAGLRRKQQALTALGDNLDRELQGRGVPGAAIRCVTEIVKAEAVQLRLTLDGGAPWETLRTENTIFRVMHGDASRSQRFFRWITLLPACLLPPRWFYAGRSWLASRDWYRRARRKWLPVPAITRAAGPDESG